MPLRRTWSERDLLARIDTIDDRLKTVIAWPRDLKRQQLFLSYQRAVVPTPSNWTASGRISQKEDPIFVERYGATGIPRPIQPACRSRAHLGHRELVVKSVQKQVSAARAEDRLPAHCHLTVQLRHEVENRNHRKDTQGREARANAVVADTCGRDLRSRHRGRIRQLITCRQPAQTRIQDVRNCRANGERLQVQYLQATDPAELLDLARTAFLAMIEKTDE